MTSRHREALTLLHAVCKFFLLRLPFLPRVKADAVIEARGSGEGWDILNVGPFLHTANTGVAFDFGGV